MGGVKMSEITNEKKINNFWLIIYLFVQSIVLIGIPLIWALMYKVNPTYSTFEHFQNYSVGIEGTYMLPVIGAFVGMYSEHFLDNYFHVIVSVFLILKYAFWFYVYTKMIRNNQWLWAILFNIIWMIIGLKMGHFVMVMHMGDSL